MILWGHDSPLRPPSSFFTKWQLSGMDSEWYSMGQWRSRNFVCISFSLVYSLLEVWSFVRVDCWRWNRGHWTPLWLEEWMAFSWIESSFAGSRWASFVTNHFGMMLLLLTRCCGEQSRFSSQNQSALSIGLDLPNVVIPFREFERLSLCSTGILSNLVK